MTDVEARLSMSLDAMAKQQQKAKPKTQKPKPTQKPAKQESVRGRGGRGGGRSAPRDAPRVAGRTGGPMKGSSLRGSSRGAPYQRRGHSGRPNRADATSEWKHDLADGQPRPDIRSRLSTVIDKYEEPQHKIKITHLPFDVIEADLVELFGSVGQVTKAQVVYGKDNRSTGTAFVSFTSERNAKAAVEQYNNRAIDNNKLEITYIPPKVTVSNKPLKGQRAEPEAAPARSNKYDNIEDIKITVKY